MKKWSRLFWKDVGFSNIEKLCQIALPNIRGGWFIYFHEILKGTGLEAFKFIVLLQSICSTEGEYGVCSDIELPHLFHLRAPIIMIAKAIKIIAVREVKVQWAYGRGWCSTWNSPLYLILDGLLDGFCVGASKQVCQFLCPVHHLGPRLQDFGFICQNDVLHGTHVTFWMHGDFSCRLDKSGPDQILGFTDLVCVNCADGVH